MKQGHTLKTEEMKGGHSQLHVGENILYGAPDQEGLHVDTGEKEGRRKPDGSLWWEKREPAKKKVAIVNTERGT